MTGWFVDSNVFLRFVIRDETEQAAAAQALFRQAQQGEIALFCGPPVFFEVAWVLKSAYKLENTVILDFLESMLALPQLTVFDADQVAQAITLARERGLGFADGYIAATAAERNLGVASFNRAHFQKAGAQLYPFPH